MSPLFRLLNLSYADYVICKSRKKIYHKYLVTGKCSNNISGGKMGKHASNLHVNSLFTPEPTHCIYFQLIMESELIAVYP